MLGPIRQRHEFDTFQSGKPFGFRRLIRAQAAGDYASLEERGRRVARIHIEDS